MTGHDSADEPDTRVILQQIYLLRPFLSLLSTIDFKLLYTNQRAIFLTLYYLNIDITGQNWKNTWQIFFV